MTSKMTQASSVHFYNIPSVCSAPSQFSVHHRTCGLPPPPILYHHRGMDQPLSPNNHVKNDHLAFQCMEKNPRSSVNQYLFFFFFFNKCFQLYVIKKECCDEHLCSCLLPHIPVQFILFGGKFPDMKLLGQMLQQKHAAPRPSRFSIYLHLTRPGQGLVSEPFPTSPSPHGLMLLS